MTIAGVQPKVPFDEQFVSLMIKKSELDLISDRSLTSKDWPDVAMVFCDLTKGDMGCLVQLHNRNLQVLSKLKADNSEEFAKHWIESCVKSHLQANMRQLAADLARLGDVSHLRSIQHAFPVTGKRFTVPHGTKNDFIKQSDVESLRDFLAGMNITSSQLRIIGGYLGIPINRLRGELSPHMCADIIIRYSGETKTLYSWKRVALACSQVGIGNVAEREDKPNLGEAEQKGHLNYSRDEVKSTRPVNRYESVGGSHLVETSNKYQQSRVREWEASRVSSHASVMNLTLAGTYQPKDSKSFAQSQKWVDTEQTGEPVLSRHEYNGFPQDDVLSQAFSPVELTPVNVLSGSIYSSGLTHTLTPKVGYHSGGVPQPSSKRRERGRSQEQHWQSSVREGHYKSVPSRYTGHLHQEHSHPLESHRGREHLSLNETSHKTSGSGDFSQSNKVMRSKPQRVPLPPDSDPGHSRTRLATQSNGAFSSPPTAFSQEYLAQSAQQPMGGYQPQMGSSQPNVLEHERGNPSRHVGYPEMHGYSMSQPSQSHILGAAGTTPKRPQNMYESLPAAQHPRPRPILVEGSARRGGSVWVQPGMSRVKTLPPPAPSLAKKPRFIWPWNKNQSKSSHDVRRGAETGLQHNVVVLTEVAKTNVTAESAQQLSNVLTGLTAHQVENLVLRLSNNHHKRTKCYFKVPDRGLSVNNQYVRMLMSQKRSLSIAELIEIIVDESNTCSWKEIKAALIKEKFVVTANRIRFASK